MKNVIINFNIVKIPVLMLFISFYSQGCQAENLNPSISSNNNLIDQTLSKDLNTTNNDKMMTDDNVSHKRKRDQNAEDANKKIKTNDIKSDEFSQVSQKIEISLEDILIKPSVLNRVIGTIRFDGATSLNLINKRMYAIISGWNQIGQKGLDITIPKIETDDQEIGNHEKRKNPYRHNQNHKYFDINNYCPEEIPSMPFFRMIQYVADIPKQYWEYLPQTNVTSICLPYQSIEDKDFAKLWKVITSTKIIAVDLEKNNITDAVVELIIQSPKDISLENLNLKKNKLTKENQKAIIKAYPNISWVF